jgi:hypothetical protein
MATLTIKEIQQQFQSEKMSFMKQGSGKLIHISSISGFADYNNLLHGSSFPMRGNRNKSKLMVAYMQEIETEFVCKNCLEVFEKAVAFAKVGA